MKKAFTIIELLIVISIISVLVGMVFFVATLVRNRGVNSKIDADLSMFKIALLQYQKEKGMLPTSTASDSWCKIGVDTDCLKELLDGKYVAKLQKGPNDKCGPLSGDFDKECYYYFVGSNYVSISAIKTPAKYGDFPAAKDCSSTTTTTGGTKRFCVGVMK
ncbi:MAG: hypothetical protein Athens101428_326 [Candidatus Berkelbacteria bacterium Athens1014_28]|uniref:General secretion pathway protein GspG n=1 Tax=Candidatus Berkelbacteria bacterium Athens1014_28 TaxID=2017145 RepID=A0A554LN75_9BACT|nr:MAG: hypothetical protein Athens101428_326 [Candidatus Berkelbacteria bacterium Athens1014_28]